MILGLILIQQSATSHCRPLISLFSFAADHQRYNCLLISAGLARDKNGFKNREVFSGDGWDV
jgi:hypothetical protein